MINCLQFLGFEKLFISTLSMFFFFAVILGGCKDKGACEMLYEKNKKCADQYVQYVQEDAQKKMDKALEKARDDKVREDMKKRISKELEEVGRSMRDAMASDAFLTECKKNWGSEERAHIEKKKKLGRCLKKKDCDAYVECVLSVIIVNR